MDQSQLHNLLKRQIKKYLPESLIDENQSLQSFILAIHQSYVNYDKDADLFEQSMRLNDIEFHNIYSKIKNEFEKNKVIQSKLIEVIKQLNTSKEIVPFDEDEDFSSLFAILHDEIEFKKKYAEELFAAKLNAEKANEAKSDFLSIMSHEIRTPLNAIIGLAYILEKETDIISIKENIEILKNSAKNLHNLLNDILDFNKIEAGKIALEKTPFNYKNLVSEIVQSLDHKAHENLNTLKVTIADDLTTNVIGDPLRLSQIITNLVSNAIKFTKNGTIEIKIEKVTQSDTHLQFKTQIIDNGIGIDLNKFQSIFEKFTQADSKTSREYGGTGLGLVITKMLLRLFESDIELESELGVGSNFNFTLTLPLFHKEDEKESSLISNTSGEKMLTGLKILLVEDNLINIKIAEKILNQWQVELDVAHNGQIGVNMFNAKNYDVILMDLSMPIMDGYEATAIIRLSNSEIPIIALTASTSCLSLDKAMQLGVTECVTKPFIPKELNIKLSKYLS